MPPRQTSGRPPAHDSIARAGLVPTKAPVELVWKETGRLQSKQSAVLSAAQTQWRELPLVERLDDEVAAADQDGDAVKKRYKQDGHWNLQVFPTRGS